MANLLNQLTIDNVNYDLYDSEFIIDTRTASGAALTGVSHAPELFDGMQITFWMNYAAASNATLNLTLADGTTTGAIPCYYSGTTRLGTNYAAGNAIRFVYRENVTIGSTTIAAGWWSDANYTVSDTNYDIVGVSIPIKTRLNAYCLCAMVGTSGTIAKQTRTVGAGTYWEINAFTQSSGTGQTKKLIPNQGYYPGKLFYHTGSSAITDTDAVSGTISGGTNNFDLRYTVNGSSSANIGVTGAPFFLVGSIGSDGLFYPNGHASEATAEWWQCGFPTDLTSTYVYWYVGMMTSKYQCRLSDHNWMIKSDGTKWIVFDASKSVDWSNITSKPSTFTPSSHTHGYISNDGAITDAVATTPASGDKIVVTDASDSNKVKGAITIGSDDGKFLRHDGTWQDVSTDDHILVMTGTPTGDITTGSVITTTTAWTDFLVAIVVMDRLILDMPSSGMQLDLAYRLTSNDNPTFVLLTTDAVFSLGGYINLMPITFIGEEDNNHNVQLYYQSSVRTMAAVAGAADRADYADSAPWSGITSNPYPTDVPSSDGNYSLNVSGGTSSWTTASGGIDTPDAPGTDGNYVLNVDNGSSSWQSIDIPDGSLIVEFNGNFQSETPKADIDTAISEGRPIYMLFSNIVAVLLSKMSQSPGSTYAGDYYYFIVPTDMGSSSVLYPQTYVFKFIDAVSYTQAQPFCMTGYDSSDYLVSDAGSPSSLTYSSTTASRATLTNGLLSFGDVSASNITNWSAGTTPTLTKGTSAGIPNTAIQTLVPFIWD